MYNSKKLNDQLPDRPSSLVWIGLQVFQFQKPDRKSAIAANANTQNLGLDSGQALQCKNVISVLNSFNLLSGDIVSMYLDRPAENKQTKEFFLRWKQTLCTS